MTSRSIIGPFGISLLCIAICLVALFVQAPPILAALVQPKTEVVGTDDKVAELVEQHAAEAELFAKRYEGRSAFFVPPRPVVPIETGPRAAIKKLDPRTDPAPPEYGGPLTPDWSVEQDVIIFSGGIELKIGEQRQSVKLVAVHLPYSVTVEWTKLPQGIISYETGTYTIPFRTGLFEGSTPALLTEAPKPGARKLEGGGGPAITRPGRGRNDPRLDRFQNRNRRSNEDDEDQED